MLDDGTSGSHGENSSKGLGLPRVELNTLEPVNGKLAESIGASSATTGIWDEVAHTGLVVYNVKGSNDICNPNTPPPVGLYVWNGKNWQIVGIKENDEDIDHFSETWDNATNTGTVTDYEGNVYSTKRWKSTDASKISAIWMTKNLHSIRKADGLFIDCPNGLRLNPAYNANSTGAMIVKNIIPEGIVGTYVNAGVSVQNQSYVDFAENFGLMYSHAQASIACPRGWRLPNDSDWDLLVESMDGTIGSNSVGHAMKASTNKNFISADGSTNNWTKGNTVVENGFNALPSGFVNVGGVSARNFSLSAGWWSATSTGSYRYLNSNNSQLIGEGGSHRILLFGALYQVLTCYPTDRNILSSS